MTNEDHGETSRDGRTQYVKFICTGCYYVSEGNGVSLKMPPRLSARRLFLLILFFFTVSLLVSLHQRFSWLSVVETGQQEEKKYSDEVVASLAPPAARVELSADLDKAEPTTTVRQQGKPWFMTGGTEYPGNYKGPPRLFPDQADGDRIVDQLMYLPEDYQGYDTPEKVILTYNGLGAWGQKSGSAAFHGCPVNRCTLTDDRSKAANADALMFKDHFVHPGVARPSKQVWILYFLECPYHTQSIKFSDLINWTATYRRDSDIVAPYERWTYYDSQVRQKVQNRDYVANKTKKVAWFVSNCGARNNRLAYARELGKYIPVDIYGTCGPLKCPRSDKKCFDILDKEYNFI
ncbi:hypothetical protein JTB14_012703 [Gonioctena quinquepunctata]|nr:hypothetical protein JTB14_012703 [Gonioctena quinquepunctata]